MQNRNLVMDEKVIIDQAEEAAKELLSSVKNSLRGMILMENNGILALFDIDGHWCVERAVIIRLL